MQTFEHPRDLVRFGDYELDPATGELTNAGSTIRLQPQPLKVLLALIRSPGELVTREQLKQEVMSETPYGDADHAINLAVAKLRVALKDSSDEPEFIDTLPRRGYRFVAAVQQLSGLKRKQTVQKHRNGRRILYAILTGLLAMAIASTVIFSALRRGTTEKKHTTVIATFTNNTGDAAFDTTLRQVVSARIQRSPSFTFLSDERISEVLSLMKQTPGTRITNRLALEVCQRTASAAAIDGSISMVGSQYLIDLRAMNCFSGELLAHEQASRTGKEEVISGIEDASTKLKESLEQSLRAGKQDSSASEHVTTGSVEALQAYSLAQREMTSNRDDSSAIPMYQRAIDLDPEFAMAHAELGLLYKNIGQSGRAAEAIRKAYDSRQQVSAHEKIAIEAHYEYMVTGNLEAARKKYTVWASLYPEDAAPLVALSSIYTSSGKCDEAVALLEKAQAIAPHDGAIRSNIVEAELCRGDLDRAVAVAEEAIARSTDAARMHLDLYVVSFLRHDDEGLRKQSDYLSRLPDWRAHLLCTQAMTAAFEGRLKEARSLVRMSSDVALLADEPESAAVCQAQAAVWEAISGNTHEAWEEAEAALLISDSRDVEADAAVALALAGNSAEASSIVRDLLRRFPADSIVRWNRVPLIRAITASASGKSSEALTALLPIESSGLRDALTTYVSGATFFAANRPALAVTEFLKIVDHPSLARNHPVAALAQVELGRAYEKAGEKQKARAAYERFLELWKNGDPNARVLRQARAGYQRMCSVNCR